MFRVVAAQQHNDETRAGQRKQTVFAIGTPRQTSSAARPRPVDTPISQPPSAAMWKRMTQGERLDWLYTAVMIVGT